MSKSNVVRLLAAFSLIAVIIAVIGLFTPNINLNNKEIGIELKDGQTIKGKLITEDLDSKKNDQVLGATTKEGELKVLVNENDELVVKAPGEEDTPFSFPIGSTENITSINNISEGDITITSISGNLPVTTSGQNVTLNLLQGSGSGLNSDLLDGFDSSFFRNADLLDGFDSTFFRNASNINAGLLGNTYFDAYSDLADQGYLDNNSNTDVLLKGQANDLYVNVTGDTMSGALTINSPYASTLAPALTVNGLTRLSEDLYVYGKTILVDDLVGFANTRFDGTLRVLGTSTFEGASYFNFDTYLGNSASDALFFLGRATSDLVPMVDNTYSLGTSALRWANIYAANLSADCFSSMGGSTYCDSAHIVDNLSVDENAQVLGSLEVGLTAIGDPVFSVLRTGDNGFEIPEATNFEAKLIGDLRVEGTVDASELNIRAIHTAASGIRLFDLTNNELFVVNSTGDMYTRGNIATDGTSFLNGEVRIGNSDADIVRFYSLVRSDILPDGDGIYSLGSAAHSWANLFVDNIFADCFTTTRGSSYCDDANILGNATVGGNLNVNGEIYNSTGTVVVNDNLRATGDVFLGNANSDRVVITGPISSGDSDPLTIEDNSGMIITRRDDPFRTLLWVDGAGTTTFFGNAMPSWDSLFNLGSDTTRWANVYSDNTTTETSFVDFSLQVGGGFGDADGGLTIDEFGALRTNRYMNVAGGYGDADGGLTLTDTGDIYMDGFLATGAGYGAGGATITQSGDASFSGALTVDSNSFINAQLTVNDLVVNNMATFLGTVDSDLIPDIDNVYSLGNTTYRWANAYLGNADLTGNLNVLGTLSITGYADVASELTNINSSVTLLQTDVTNLQTAMTTAQTDITNLQADVTALQARNVVTGGVDLTCAGVTTAAGFTCVINVGAPIQSITFTPITASAGPNTRVALVSDPTGSNTATIIVTGPGGAGADTVTGVAWTAVLQ